MDTPGIKVVPVSKKRDIGIEILRMAAMYLIVCQHFLNHGGFMKGAGEHTLLLNIINVLFAPSVDVFVLISGYFASSSTRLKIGKIGMLYLQVIFYSVLMPLLAAAVGYELTLANYYKAVSPLLSRGYWFFSTYILLMIAAPYLSALISGISQKQHGAIVIGTFALGFASLRFGITSVLSFAAGYSFIWFILLYLTGAYFKKYPPRVKKIAVFAVYIVASLLLLLFKYHLTDTSVFWIKMIYSTTDYTQPLTLLAAICLLLLFRGVGDGSTKVGRAVTFVSASTFGVYLFHETAAIRSVLYTKVFHTSSYFGLAESGLYVIVFAAIVFAIGILIDLVRRLIFYYVGKLCGLLIGKYRAAKQHNVTE